MAKKDDELEEKVQHIFDSKQLRLMRWICVTASSITIATIYQIGGFIYDRWEQFSAAIDAFIKAGRQ